MANEEDRRPAAACISVVILGDLHGHWDDEDERYYAALPCQLLLWTGDLADFTGQQCVVARSLARCGPKAVGLLGNHDGASPLLASCEAHGYRVLERCLSFGHAARVRHLRSILREHDIGLARRELPCQGLTLIGLCPLQSGGARLAFAKTLWRVYGTSDPEPLLRRLIDEAQSRRLLLLGHNGPAGLGSEPLAPFGRDWSPTGGDHGDPIFERLLDHASRTGKEVVLAVGGHMHDDCRGQAREALRYAKRTPVLNACRVPRLERRGSAKWRWDYRAELTLGAGLRKLERTAWVAGEGIVSRENVMPVASDAAMPAPSPALEQTGGA
jgi:uncharacterized protein (TIGR04168 family)